MKHLPLILFLFLFFNNVFAQNTEKGKVITEKFLAASIDGNRGGEEPMRRVTVYLPPGYEKSQQRYPVIYYLHGFLVDDNIMMYVNRTKELMDSAIVSGRMRPMILVSPNSDTKFGGSGYTNSALTGNWADYIVKDVVDFTDKKYRTLPDKNSRGLTGHSMGGNGALKIAMLYPGVFGTVYALSPGALDWGADFSLNSPAFKNMDSFRNELSGMQILTSVRNGEPEAYKNFNMKVMADLARTYSPNEEKTFLSASMPVRYVGDSMIVDKEVVKKWEANFPLNMIDGHLAELKSLNALKLDWGRYDELSSIPITCLEFSKKLEANGVKHFAEEYLGGHMDKQGGFEGRMYTDVLPFLTLT